MTFDSQARRFAHELPPVGADNIEGDQQLAAIKNRVSELEVRLLASRDFAIGAEAELSRLRESQNDAKRRVKRVRSKLERAALERDQLLGRVRELEAELDAVHASRSWRMGRWLSSPLRAMRRGSQ